MRAGDERYLQPARPRPGAPDGPRHRRLAPQRRRRCSCCPRSSTSPACSFPACRSRPRSPRCWLTVLILLVVDSAVIGLRIRKLMRERYPDSQGAAVQADLLRRDPGDDDPPLADCRSPAVDVGDAI